MLRRAGIVRAVREGTTVTYSLSTPEVADLLADGRKILAAVWTGTEGMLNELRGSS